MNTPLPFLARALLVVAGSTAQGQPAWQIEFEAGQPVRLTWSTAIGQTYQLDQATELPLWSPVPGFPQIATNSTMHHAFVPGAQAFFRIATTGTLGGWQPISLPALPADSRFDLVAVTAVDPLHLWACGTIRPSGDSCVIRSTDGGADWTLTYRAAGVGFFGDLQMATVDTGYVAGSGLHRTTDGGVTWLPDQGNLPDPPGTWHSVGPVGYVYGLAVVSADQVWTAGYDGASAGVLYHREPGRPQPNPTLPNENTPWWLEWAAERQALYGVSAVNPSQAWAVGFAGAIWVTLDGQSWTPQASPTSAALQDVDAVDASTVWAVGDAGTILKTTNGGATWTPQTSGTTETLWRVAAVNADVAWAVGGGGVILHTRNGGASWVRQWSGTPRGLYGVTAVDADTAWIVGEGDTLLRTVDGGRGAWTAPVVSSVAPNVVGVNSWPPIELTVTGSGFRGGGLSVTIGGTPATAITWINASTLRVVAPMLSAGTLDVVVTNEDGQPGRLARALTVLPEPVITAYRPWHGPAAGGFEVTLEGFNLQSVSRATLVLNGSEEELAVHIEDATRVRLSLPISEARPTGAATLMLTSAENQYANAEDLLLDPAEGPAFAVTSITPTTGPSATSVTVSGVGFGPGTTLDLCDRPVAITQRSATELTGRVSGSPGLGRMLLANSDTEVIRVGPAFWLLSGTPPTLLQVLPATGSAAGGDTVTLEGAGFTDTDTVTFGGHVAEVTARSETSLTVIVPPHPPGTVSVAVMTADLERGAAVLPGGFTYH